jgi:hypothetical protein
MSLRIPTRLEKLRPYLPWAALVALCVLFELPTMMRPDRLDPTAMRPTGEVVALVTAYAVCRVLEAPRVFRWLLLVLTLALVVVRLDWAIYFLITRSEPLLYDQLFMLRHLAVLVGDLWSPSVAAVLVAFVMGCVLVTLGARALVKGMDPIFATNNRRKLAVVLASAWALVLAATAWPAGAKTPERIHWLSRNVAHNVGESTNIYAEIERGIRESPYRAYDGIELGRKPNVSLLFVESYGRIVSDSDDLSPRWTAALERMEARLRGAGWHMVSAYSTAPVSAGRSWLAVTSVLTGTHVEYEAVFRHMLDRMDRIPSLVKFLQKHGYHTVALEPSDRIRPGVEEVNYHGFERILRFDDVRYRGPKAGWGLVPDQYSLGFAEEHVLQVDTSPRLFQFHMVTSHMPWTDVPNYVDDWRALNDAKGNPVDFPNYTELTKRLSRYGREESHRWILYGGLPEDYRARYLESIEYDLQVIEEHLARTTGEDLVIVMGDHQPPVIAPERANFDVPVHVFSRDSSMLDEFRERGFIDGLRLGRAERPALEHGGFFSLLVRALVRCCGSGSPPPTYLRSGIPMGA